MATLATIFNRFMVGTSRTDVETSLARNAGKAKPEDACRVRALPNEDVFFFTKHIDNSRVARQEDPRSRDACLKILLGAIFVVVLMTSLLRFGALSLVDGYQIQTLKQEQQRLTNERAALELEEAKLVSPQRLEDLAKLQQFIDPPPGSVVYLDSKSDAVAMNNAGGQ